MAIIKLSAIVSDIRGTVGGNVFSRNKGGAYVRTFVKPNNPQTTAQANIRSLFGALASSWRALTQAQRNAWNTITPQYPYQDKLGTTKTYSGEQLYIKLNTNLNAAQEGLISEPAIPIEFPSYTMEKMEADRSNARLIIPILALGEPLVPTGFTAIFEATQGLSQGIGAPQRGLFKQIFILGEGEDTSADNLFTGYNAIFGKLVVGTKVFARVKLVNTSTGEMSTHQETFTTVVA